MKKVEELKKAVKFIVEEWMDVYRANGVVSTNSGYKVREYTFEFDDNQLIISDGKSEYELEEVEKTLYDLSKEEHVLFVQIIPKEGPSFNLYNPRIRFE